jgi:hypothetical protein
MALHRASPTVAVCEMLRMDSERERSVPRRIAGVAASLLGPLLLRRR